MYELLLAHILFAAPWTVGVKSSHRAGKQLKLIRTSASEPRGRSFSSWPLFAGTSLVSGPCCCRPRFRARFLRDSSCLAFRLLRRGRFADDFPLCDFFLLDFPLSDFFLRRLFPCCFLCSGLFHAARFACALLLDRLFPRAFLGNFPSCGQTPSGRRFLARRFSCGLFLVFSDGFFCSHRSSLQAILGNGRLYPRLGSEEAPGLKKSQKSLAQSSHQDSVPGLSRLVGLGFHSNRGLRPRLPLQTGSQRPLSRAITQSPGAISALR